MNEDKAVRYNRLKRRSSVLSLAWTVVFLLLLVFTGASVSLRTAAESLAARAGVPATSLPLYVLLLIALNEIVSLPIAFHSGFVVERRYGLSRESFGAWLGDQAKAMALGAGLSIGAAAIVYGSMRVSLAWWWLIAGGAFALVIVSLANLAPVVLLPLFYRVQPLGREALRTRLLALAERAGARVLGAYEWGLGDKTRKANAALAGLGSTRRILVSDTMLREYSDEEIEVVLAHELAHHVHGDIWKGIALEAALIVAGFAFAARILEAAAGPAGLRGVSDVAGIPILLLAAGAVSMATLPAAHALSRAYERNADRFALDLTNNPGAFVSAMRRLGAQNLAEEHPSKIVQWLFYSHPPLAERIAAAERYRAA